MKKWYQKQAYFEAKDKSFYKKGLKLSEALELVYHSWGDLMNKVKFGLKVVLLIRPGTYWVMFYIKLK